MAGILKQDFLPLTDGYGIVYGSGSSGETSNRVFQHFHAFGYSKRLSADVEEYKGHGSGPGIYPVNNELVEILLYHLASF